MSLENGYASEKTSTNNSIEENKESVTVIWFDPVEDKMKSVEEIKKDLRTVNNLLICPPTIDACINEIESRRQDQIFLISGRNNLNELLPKLKDFPQLDRVFIFPDQTNESIDLVSNSTKVVNSLTNSNDLIESIQQNTERVYQQMEMTFFNDQHQRGVRDLSEQSAEFLWFQQFKSVVQKSPRDEQAKEDMLTACRLYYQNNPRVLNDIDEFEQTYCEEDCIHWYTRDRFVYRLINRALRTEDIEQLYVFRYYIGNLSEQLVKRYEILKNGPEKQFVLYRGTQMSAEELEIYQDNVGKSIAINSYWSTSRKREIGPIFAGQANQPKERAVLFEIECNLDDENNSAMFCDISIESEFPLEEEVLFDAGSILQIKSVKEEKHGYNDFYVIRLATGGEKRDIERRYMNAIDREIEYESPRIMLGIFLKRIGKYDKSLKYFEELLKNPGEENIAHIHNRIGIALKLQQRHDKALDHFNQAYDLISEFYPSERVYLAFIRHNQGQIHSRETEASSQAFALAYYQEAVDIIKKEIPEPNRYLADYYASIGRVYLKQQEYEQAMDKQNEALETRKACLFSDHVICAFSYTDIAKIFSAEGKYQDALENNLQALELRQKYLLSNHLNTARSLYYVGKAYHKMSKTDKALDYYFKALKMKRKCLSDSRPFITPSILRDIALVYGYNSPTAVQYFEEALNISIQGETKDFSALSRLLDDIARTYKSLNRTTDLLHFYERALQIRTEFLPDDKLNLARLLENMTTMYKSMKNGQDLLEFYQKALTIREKFLRHDRFNLARLMDDIACQYNRMGNARNSIRFNRKVLKVRQEYLSNNDLKLSHNFRHLAILHEKLGDIRSAHDNYGELLRIYEYHYDYGDHRCEQIRRNIRRIERRFR